MSYQAPPPPPPNPYGGMPAQQTNQKAVWALVLGIVSLLCCGFLTGIPAIILGQSAGKEIAMTGQGGSGMAKAGLILGIVATALSVLGVILWGAGVPGFNFEFSTGG